MIFVWCALTFLTTAEEPLVADVVIRGGLVVDGSGRPGVIGDVALRGDKIVGVGRFTLAGKPKDFDATGLVVAPGFIDLHTHSDDALIRAPTNGNLDYLLQGVTTVVTGNCGSGPVGVADYFRTLEQIRTGSNVIHLVPHNTLRRTVMGNVNRSPTQEEMTKMVALTEQGMKDGAWGLSTGLIYNPGAFAQTEELIVLGRVAAGLGGIYVSHIRTEGVGVLAAMEEALTIGREAGLPVHLSHLKASGKKAWGKALDEIALVEKARKQGQIVSADQYPYTASSTSLEASVMPARFREGTRQEFLKRLADPEQGKLIRQAIEAALAEMEGGRLLRIAHYRSNPSWAGKNVAALAEQEHKKAVDVVLEILKNGGAQIIYFGMSEEDLKVIMKQPWVATASDGSTRLPDASIKPHPRGFGCFARKIGRFAIEDEILSMEQALRSCSGLPADILKLTNRGYLKPGMKADVVVFDPKTFRDTATYDQPQRYATGMRQVYVNGKLAIQNGKTTGVLAGQVLRHKKE